MLKLLKALQINTKDDAEQIEDVFGNLSIESPVTQSIAKDGQLCFFVDLIVKAECCNIAQKWKQIITSSTWMINMPNGEFRFCDNSEFELILKEIENKDIENDKPK